MYGLKRTESKKLPRAAFSFFFGINFPTVIKNDKKLLAEPSISLYDVKRNNYYL